MSISASTAERERQIASRVASRVVFGNLGQQLLALTTTKRKKKTLVGYAFFRFFRRHCLFSASDAASTSVQTSLGHSDVQRETEHLPSK